MNANWWGLVGENVTKAVGRISKTSEVISGIPGSGADQDGVPYSLTEEFTSVYRMHSLIPGNSSQAEVVYQLILTDLRQHCVLQRGQWKASKNNST